MLRTGLLPALLLSLLAPPSLFAQPDTLSRAERLEDLRRHVTPIRSVDPADEDFSDLSPLKEAIGDRQIVILGEPSHGDGTAFQAKSRLVKFLHEKMDFDVLAFETGLYDLRLATAQASSFKEHLQAAANNLSRPWAKSKQARPALRYYAQTTQTNDPLHLAGIDGALRPPNDSIFTARLKRHLQATGYWQTATARMDFAPTLRTQLVNPLALARDTARYRQFVSVLNTLTDTLRGGSSEDRFWGLMLENVKAMTQTGFQRSYEPRNRQMAETLAWLAREKYADENIIVWIASSHGIRNLSSIERINAKRSYEGQKSMGDFLAAAFDGGIYTLGFTAYEGKFGAFYWDRRETQTISSPSANSLEDLLGALSSDYSLLNLSAVPKDHWLSRPQVARPLGYEEMRADWTRVMDGLFFIRKMAPNTKVEQ